jgi:dihydropteroate synthase
MFESSGRNHGPLAGVVRLPLVESRLMFHDPLKQDFTPLLWSFPGANWQLGAFPKLMGIVNVTPDSFSDGGQFLDPARAADHALELVAAGADIVDIGGESTRPGATPLSIEEELQRVIPVIERVAKQVATPISVDTTKSQVAQKALEAGAVIVNDISGLTFDPAMASVCARARAGVVCMHIQGTPATMQLNPQYDNVVSEIADYLAARLAALEQVGIPRERVVVDPGIGFGKMAAHNLAILQNLGRFRSLGRPVLVGHSRKRFLGKLLGRPLDELLAGTVGVAVALTLLGVDILRVHDLQAVRDALTAFHAVIKK